MKQASLFPGAKPPKPPLDIHRCDVCGKAAGRGFGPPRHPRAFWLCEAHKGRAGGAT